MRDVDEDSICAVTQHESRELFGPLAEVEVERPPPDDEALFERRAVLLANHPREASAGLLWAVCGDVEDGLATRGHGEPENVLAQPDGRQRHLLCECCLPYSRRPNEKQQLARRPEDLRPSTPYGGLVCRSVENEGRAVEDLPASPDSGPFDRGTDVRGSRRYELSALFDTGIRGHRLRSPSNAPARRAC